MSPTLKFITALATVVPVLAHAAPGHIQATFSGVFLTQMRQPVGGGLSTSSISVPFTAQMQILIDSPQYTVFPGANTTQTSFSGPAFNTSLTPAVLAAFPANSNPTFTYSHSVYWFGNNPSGQQNDFLSLAKGDELNATLGQQWVHQLSIRSAVMLPPELQQGPIDAEALFTALTQARDSSRVFNVTEFYEVYPLAGGPRIEANWYMGSATLNSVSIVPEPSAVVLLSIGIALIVRRRRDAPLSSGAPTAGHQARPGGTRHICASPGLAYCRSRPLSSNVRPPLIKALPPPASRTNEQSAPRDPLPLHIESGSLWDSG